MSDTPVAPLPPSYNWGFVVGRSISAMADTAADPDRLPEARGSNGRVTFTPHTRYKKEVSAPTAFVQFEVITARIVNGNIVDAQGEDGIYLISGAYKVAFTIDSGSIPGFDILVTPDYTIENPLDLVTASPFVPEVGTPVTTAILPLGAAEDQVIAWRNGRLVWVNGSAQAEAAAARAEVAATAAEEWAPSFVWEGTALSINGGEPVDLKADPGIAGMVPIFATLAEAQAWELANPGRSALTTETPPDPGAWAAAAPGFDLVSGRVTIPTDAGATYTINGAAKAAGSHAATVPSTVTVAAVAKPGYVLAGQTEWVQQFEENVNPYTAAVLALNPQHYFEFSDGGTPPRDRGTAAGAPFSATTVNTAGPAIGVGPSSFEQTGTGQLILQSRPSATVPAFSYAAVIHPTAGLITTLFQSWGSVATFQIGNAWGSHKAQVKFPGMTASTQFEAPGAFLRRMHVAFTWDGSTGRVYMDGAEIGVAAATGTLGALAGTILLQPTAGATVAMAGATLDFTRAWSAAEVASLASEVGA